MIQKLHLSYDSLKNSPKFFLFFFFFPVGKTSISQERKLEEKEEVHVLTFAPEATWVLIGQEGKHMDTLCPPRLEGIHGHTWEVCDTWCFLLLTRNGEKKCI